MAIKQQSRFNISIQLIGYLLMVVVICVVDICVARPTEDENLNALHRLMGHHLNGDNSIIKRDNVHKNFQKNTLKITEAPPANIVVKEGSSKVLECTATGSPPPKMHWLKNGHRVEQPMEELLGVIADETDFNKDGEIGIGVSKSKLYLDCLRPQDNGDYTCVAETVFSRVSVSTKVTVDASKKDFGEEINDNYNEISGCFSKKSHSTKPRINMWTLSRLEVIGTPKVQLYCRASGASNGVTTWKLRSKNETLVNGSKYQILDNGDLVVNNLVWEDLDNYICHVRNRHGSDEVTSFLYPTAPEKK